MEELVNFLGGKKHVIWDWNGTLLNDVEHCLSTMNQMLKARALPLLSLQGYREIFTFPIVNYYHAAGFDFTKEPFEALSLEWVSHYMDGFRQCSLVAGAEDCLRLIQALGFTQSILSASDQESLNEVIGHYALKPYFHSVFGIGDKFATSKLARGKELLALSPHSAAETILIGDTDHDLKVGKELGIDVVLVGHGHQCAKRHLKIHDKVLSF
jgi:phosphoglycolate phosphatase